MWASSRRTTQYWLRQDIHSSFFALNLNMQGTEKTEVSSSVYPLLKTGRKKNIQSFWMV